MSLARSRWGVANRYGWGVVRIPLRPQLASSRPTNVPVLSAIGAAAQAEGRLIPPTDLACIAAFVILAVIGIAILPQEDALEDSAIRIVAFESEPEIVEPFPVPPPPEIARVEPEPKIVPKPPEPKLAPKPPPVKVALEKPKPPPIVKPKPKATPKPRIIEMDALAKAPPPAPVEKLEKRPRPRPAIAPLAPAKRRPQTPDALATRPQPSERLARRQLPPSQAKAPANAPALPAAELAPLARTNKPQVELASQRRRPTHETRQSEQSAKLDLSFVPAAPGPSAGLEVARSERRAPRSKPQSAFQMARGGSSTPELAVPQTRTSAPSAPSPASTRRAPARQLNTAAAQRRSGAGPTPELALPELSASRSAPPPGPPISSKRAALSAPLQTAAAAGSRAHDALAEIRGDSLASFAACMSDRLEESLKQKVIAAAGRPRQCASDTARYHFVQTRNLNSFLMYVERGPSHPSGDRCAELQRALSCLNRSAG